MFATLCFGLSSSHMYIHIVERVLPVRIMMRRLRLCRYMLRSGRVGDGQAINGEIGLRTWLKLDCVYATVRAGDRVRRIAIVTVCE